MRATEIARKMVTSWGLSSMGPLTFGEEEAGEVFLGRTVNQRNEVSNKTAEAIDAEVQAIIDRNYDRAKKLLVENIAKLHIMAKTLIKYETIDSHQIEQIMSGKEPSPPKDWDLGKPSSASPKEADVSKPKGKASKMNDLGEQSTDIL
jgi:cell division protease FtsH